MAKHGLTAENLFDAGRVYFTSEGTLVRMPEYPCPTDILTNSSDVIISPGCNNANPIHSGDLFKDGEVE